MGAESTTELLIKARNMSDGAFSAATGNLKRLKGEAADTSSFGRMEGSLRQFDDVLQLVGGPNMNDVIQGVGQLGDVANGTAGKLGGLAKAGLVASAALGGWSIGRKIAELTGSDSIIGNLTAKLMGFGDVAAQEAAAGADVLARASKNAGREIRDMAEAIRINEAAVVAHAETVTRANGPANAAAQVAAWRGEITKLRAAGVLGDFKKLVEDGTVSQGQLAKMFAISSEAASLYSSELKKQKTEQDKATKSAQDHAKALQAVSDRLSGADVVKTATEFAQAVNGGVKITKLNAEEIGKAMDAAIAVHQAAGKAIPAEWVRISTAATTASLEITKGIDSILFSMRELAETRILLPLPTLPEVKKGFGDLLSQLPGAVSGLSIPKMALFEKIFGTPKEFGAQLSSTILGAIQGGGNVADAAGGLIGSKLGSKVGLELGAYFGKAGAGQFSQALGGMFSAVMPGIGALMGPLLGKIGGAIAGLFNRDQGRDLVKEWAQSITGSADLNAMHRLLSEKIPADAERIWIALTQGGAHGNPAIARAVISEATALLAAQEKQITAGAAAAESAAQRHSAAQQAALDGAKDRVKALDNEIKSLQDSIANEAVEEEMGIVERLTREKIASLETQREEAAAVMEDLTRQLAESMDRVADAIEQLPRELDFHVRTFFEDGGYTGGHGGREPVPSHDSGAYIREDHLAMVHAGEMIGDAAWFARQFAGGDGRGPITVHTKIVLPNGRELARVVSQEQPALLGGYGARR